MQGKIAILLPYKDQFIKDNAGSASIWVKDFSKNSRYKKNTTVFGYTNNTNKIFNDFKYINLKCKKNLYGKYVFIMKILMREKLYFMQII